MSKTNDDENVTTREARSKLAPRRGAYWHGFDKDCHLGYYKADEVRVWTTCLGRGRRQREERLAFVDDFEDADAVSAGWTSSKLVPRLVIGALRRLRRMHSSRSTIARLGLQEPPVIAIRLVFETRRFVHSDDRFGSKQIRNKFSEDAA